MVDDHPETNGIPVSRRTAITGGATFGLAALAGCLGGDDGSNGGSSSVSSEDFPEFDWDDPQFPQLASTLIDEMWFLDDGSKLEEMERIDEPRYGQNYPDWPVADPIDPDPLIFTMAPTDDPAAYEDTLEPMMANIEAETGNSVEYFIVDSYAAQVEAMRSERLHVGRFATGNTPFAVNLANGVPFSIPLEDGMYGNRLWFITRADNDDIDSLDDVAAGDYTIPHVSAGSLSGGQAPKGLLSAEGLVPHEDYEVDYSGDHEVSIRGVLEGDYEGAPVASTVVDRLARQDQIDASELKVIWGSGAFPLGAFTHLHNLHEDLIDGIRTAINDYDYEGTRIQEDLGYDTFTEIHYATHWDIVLQIQEEIGLEYTEDEV